MPSNDDDFDNVRFSTRVLKAALDEALAALGPTWRQLIFEDMAETGIILDSETKYSINEIRPYFYAAFEKDMGKLILAKVRAQLRKTK